MLARSLIVCLLGSALLHAAPLRPDKSGSWAGKKIMLKQPSVRIHGVPDRDPVHEIGPLSGMVFKVEAEADGWLRVRHRGNAGWFPKDQAVLLEEAPAFFSAKIESDPNVGAAYAYRAWANKELGKLDEAIKDYTRAIEVQPASSSWHNNRAVVWRALKNDDKALEDYTRAIQLSPSSVIALSNRGNLFIARKSYAQAEPDFLTALKVDPRHPPAHNGLARCYLAKRDFDRASHHLDEALRLDPTYHGGLLSRADLWSKRKDYGRALADCNQAVRLEPLNATGHNQRAWLLATCPDEKFRDGARAVADARLACELSSWKQGSYLDTLAAAHAEIKDFPEAIKYARRALEFDDFVRTSGPEARARLKLYEEGKPYRQE